MNTLIPFFKRMTPAILSIVLLTTVTVLPCLAAAKLTQQVDQSEVSVGEQVVVTLTIEGGSAGDIKLPPVDGLQLLGTSIQMRTMINNGSYSSAVSYNYGLVASRAGDLTIPGFNIHLRDGTDLHVQPIKIHVLSSDSAPPASATAPPQPTPPDPTANGSSIPIFNPNGPVVMPPNNPQQPPPDSSVNSASQPDGTAINPSFPKDPDGHPAKVFIMISPQTTDAYVGQTIAMRIEFYIRADVAYQQNSLPTIKGSDFLMNDLPIRFRQEEQQVGTETYIRQSWLTAIEAPKTGDFPLQMERDTYWIKSYSTSNLDPFGNFSVNRPNLAHESIDSNKFTVHVHPLPQEGRPANFTGAIGNFKVTSTAQPLSVTVGDPVTLRFIVSGQGNFDYVHAPSLADDADWKKYVASSKTEFLDESHTQAIKTFEQAVIPQKGGTIALPEANFSYFDPNAKQYISTPIALPAVTVTGSLTSSTSPAAAGTDTSSATPPKTPDFFPNRTTLGFLHTSLTPAYRQTWFWAVQGGLLYAMAMSAIFSFYRRGKMPDNSRAERLQREQSLHQEEDAMSAATSQGNALAFFIAARHAIQLQLGTQWRMNPEALTLGEIRQRDPQLAETLEPLFTQADEVIYSGGTSGNLDLAQWERHVRELLEAQPARS